MLTGLQHPLRPPILDEQGFSLIELLVAMVAATVVAGALFAVLNFSTTESATLSDKVQADQLGRVAMTRIDEELHSACISRAFVPIQEKSTSTNLIFITAYSKEAEIAQAEKHEIKWNEATHTLRDYYAKSTGGTSPNFTFPALTTNTILATNVTQAAGAPIFQYFAYATETTEGEKAPVSTLKTEHLPGAELAAGLNEKEASEASSVLVSFNAAAASGKTTRNRSTNLSSQVTFAFAVPNSETPIHDSPCQ
jgi:prepilin-type N-terminal cleavage/methylation domain-containing protein